MMYTAIILAAGSGSRMNLGYNKMFITLKNKPLFTLSMQHFLNDENCTEIILVVNSDEVDNIKTILKEQKLLDTCKLVHGSTERQFSVYNGLQHVTNDIVLIHDGARPFITKDLIEQLVNETQKYGCAIPGVKVKDTIKYVENQLIKETLPRDYLYAVQTPQACLTELIKKAHENAKKEQFLGTDEASLIEEYSSNQVKIILSSYENIKITTQDDLVYANRLYDKYFS